MQSEMKLKINIEKIVELSKKKITNDQIQNSKELRDLFENIKKLV
jgi:hypothetical protein